MKEKFINFALRVVAMVVRLLFLVYLSKETSEYTLGEYSLISTTIAIGLIIIGFEIYINGTREIIINKKEKHPQILFNQLVSYIPIYLILLPFSILVFVYDIISWKYLVLFYILLIFEHFGSEFFRLFIALEKPILANFLFVIRNASWGGAIFLLSNQNLIVLSITNILLFWIAASFFSLLYSFYELFKIYNFRDVYLDINMIKTSYGVALKFFIASFAYKIVEFSDRYFLDFYIGKDIVGIYSLFAQFGNALNTIIYTVVITLYYPILLKSINIQNKQLFLSTKKKMLREIIGISIIVFFSALLFLIPLLNAVGKASFLNYQDLFYLFLFANTIFNVSIVYHFILIGLKKDLFLMYVTLVGGAIDLIMNLVFIPIYDVWGASTAKIAAFLFILIAKYFYVKYHKSINFA